jgi:hypothetical protein
MRRILLPISILLVSAAWAVTQVDGGSNSASPAANPDSNKVSIQGCLDGDVGEFTLTDRSGATYRLYGNTQHMEEKVGHTVQLTGVKSPGAPVPGSMAAQADSEKPEALSVISFQDVSPDCDESLEQ